MEDVFHRDPIWLALDDGPGRPANQAVDCVMALRLTRRELLTLPVEIVRAVLQSVWPRNQHLTSAGRTHFVCAVSVDKVPAAYGVGAEAAANLDDHRLLIAGDNCNLLARWRDHRSPPVRIKQLVDVPPMARAPRWRPRR